MSLVNNGVIEALSVPGTVKFPAILEFPVPLTVKFPAKVLFPELSTDNNHTPAVESSANAF